MLLVVLGPTFSKLKGTVRHGASLHNSRLGLNAIEQYDLLGREQFLSKLGYGPSRRHFLRLDGHYYDALAILGAAAEIEHDGEIPDFLNGNNATDLPGDLRFPMLPQRVGMSDSLSATNEMIRLTLIKPIVLILAAKLGKYSWEVESSVNPNHRS